MGTPVPRTSLEGSKNAEKQTNSAFTYQLRIPRVIRNEHKRVICDERQGFFYNIAQGSIEESRYYLILAKDLEYGDVSELSQLLEEISKLLEAYSQAILNSDS